MRIVVAGAGGVGAAVALIARRRRFFERMVLADLDELRARRAAAAAGDDRIHATGLDASAEDDVVALLEAERADVLLNACDPRLNPPLFAAARRAGVTYLDMAMTLSEPHPERPFEEVGRLLGEDQLAAHDDWAQAGLLALVGIGVEPGLSDVLARHAADELFAEIDEVGVRDGADLAVAGHAFAPTFSIWTTIEECLNPPVVWERDRGWFTTEPFSEPEVFEFPEGIGPVECVNVEHEEVVLVPRWVDCRRVTFKYGLGDEFIGVLKTLHLLGLDAKEPVDVRGQRVAPRDVVAAVLPDPATLGDRMTGRTCAGTLVTGTGKDGRPRATYLHHVVDNERTMRDDGAQAVVWQTAVNPVVALELLQEGAWSGAGVLGPEALPARPSSTSSRPTARRPASRTATPPTRCAAADPSLGDVPRHDYADERRPSRRSTRAAVRPASFVTSHQVHRTTRRPLARRAASFAASSAQAPACWRPSTSTTRPVPSNTKSIVHRPNGTFARGSGSPRSRQSRRNARSSWLRVCGPVSARPSRRVPRCVGWRASTSRRSSSDTRSFTRAASRALRSCFADTTAARSSSVRAGVVTRMPSTTTLSRSRSKRRGRCGRIPTCSQRAVLGTITCSSLRAARQISQNVDAERSASVPSVASTAAMNPARSVAGRAPTP
jgi:saccharopine dehydrogenase (NAD+, L-lysine forming)